MLKFSTKIERTQKDDLLIFTEGLEFLICRRLPANQKVKNLCELRASSEAGGELT